MSKLRCPQCSRKSAKGGRFCPHCGASVQQVSKSVIRESDPAERERLWAMDAAPILAPAFLAKAQRPGAPSAALQLDEQARALENRWTVISPRRSESELTEAEQARARLIAKFHRDVVKAGF